MIRKGYYIAIAVWFFSICANAQYNSRLGRFQLDQVKGCNPLTVNITINAGFQCDAANPCSIAWGDGTSTISTFTHTYTTTGVFTLQILFQGQTQGFDDIQVTVTANTAPVFDLYTCAGNQVSVNVTDTNYQQYVISYDDGSSTTVPSGSLAKDTHGLTAGNHNVTVRGRNLSAADNCSSATKSILVMPTLPSASITQLTVVDNASIQLLLNTQQNIQYRLEIATNAGAFQLFKMVYNSSSETIANIKPDDNYYCFRIGTFDPCANNVVSYSPTICSANVDLTVQNNSNLLTWLTNASGISDFRLNIQTGTSSSLTTTVTGSSYTHTPIICGTNYCYQLTTRYPNGSQSISLQKCGVAISTDIPAAVFNISSIVGDGDVQLEWQSVPGFTAEEYSVYKIQNGSTSLMTTTANLTATDDQYSSEDPACYKISYKDVCGNMSPMSAETCPLRLLADLEKDNSVELNWNAYNGYRNGVLNYVVEKYSDTGQLLSTNSSGSSTTYLDASQDLSRQTYVYLVKANALENGVAQSVSNRIVVIKNPNLFHPTAFTPNGDNLNDVFNVFGQYITSFEMNIFNRWGELMYTTSLLDQGWDGTYKGNPMPEGTYAFVVEIVDEAGRTFTKSGSFLLLRRNK
jgi:gliding motility-associated-like protein